MNLQPTKVRLKGFDSRSTTAFEEFFLRECVGDFQITDLTSEAAINIIDIDVCIIQHEIESMREQNPDQGIVAVSLLPRESQDSLLQCVRKPIDLKSFKALLYRMKKILFANRVEKEKENLANDEGKVAMPKNDSFKPLTVAVSNNIHNNAAVSVPKKSGRYDLEAAKFIGKNSDVDVHNPQALMRVVYSPENRLQGAFEKAIRRAKKYAKPVELTCLNTGFIIDLSKNAIFTAVGESVIKPLCLMNIEQIESLRKIKPGYTGQRLFALAHKPQGQMLKWDLSELVWKVALWSSRGKIPRNTDINLPVYLSEWPNFSRLVCFPHAMNIAAMLINKPMRLTEVARQLNIPQRYVFGFYSAAFALGIADVSRRKVDQLFDVELNYQPVENSDFASALLNFLHFGEKSSSKKTA